jgi:ketosteroid isomerase-like protein
MPDTEIEEPIRACLRRWMDVFHGDVDALDDVLADDVVLHSPVLFRPQAGKALVTMYLTAAAGSFAGVGPLAQPGGGDPSGGAVRHPDGDEWDGRFRYRREVVGGDHAVLEFETTMDGRYVNGVDMITCDADGRIVDFKVMVRPLQAVEAVREKMMAALDQFNEQQG